MFSWDRGKEGSIRRFSKQRVYLIDFQKTASAAPAFGRVHAKQQA
jgi:hypothetical protein